MPSSISSSNLRTASAVLLVGCAVIAAAVEAGARVGFHRASKIQRRFVTEYERAQTIAPSPDHRRHVLVVGNSLLLEGVEFDRLAQRLNERQWDARRLVLERTYYYDWYFGLKELLSSGARPDVVVLMLSPQQWIAQETRGDFTAHYLMTGSDVLRLSYETSVDATHTTNLLFAHYSRFWGARSELRNFCLQFLVPNMTGLVELFTAMPKYTPVLTAKGVGRIASERVAQMRDLLNSYGVRLVLLVPPTLGPQYGGNDTWEGLMHAADTAGVVALRPFDSTTFDPKSFRDAGFHLNPQGAAEYTDLLTPALEPVLENLIAQRM